MRRSVAHDLLGGTLQPWLQHEPLRLQAGGGESGCATGGGYGPASLGQLGQGLGSRVRSDLQSEPQHGTINLGGRGPGAHDGDAVDRAVFVHHGADGSRRGGRRSPQDGDDANDALLLQAVAGPTFLAWRERIANVRRGEVCDLIEAAAARSSLLQVPVRGRVLDLDQPTAGDHHRLRPSMQEHGEQDSDQRGGTDHQQPRRPPEAGRGCRDARAHRSLWPAEYRSEQPAAASAPCCRRDRLRVVGHGPDTLAAAPLSLDMRSAEGRAVERGSRPARGVPAWLLVAVPAVALFCACSSVTAASGPPVVTAVPTAVPATAAAGGPGGCHVPRAQLSYSQDAVGLVTVDPDPVGATLLWLPGASSTACTAQLTTLDVSTAAALARDIPAAPAVAPGRYNCPADDNAAVAVYLRYAHRPDAEVVNIALSGCAFLDAPGRTARAQTAAIRRDLRAVAPPDWAPSLRDR